MAAILLLLAGCGEADGPGWRTPPETPPASVQSGDVWRVRAGDGLDVRTLQSDEGPTRIRVDGPADDAIVRAIAAAERVTAVNLPDLRCDSETLIALLQKPGMTSLRVGGGPEWDRAVREAVASTSLRHFHLIARPITAADLTAVASVSSLRSFYFDGPTVDATGWERFFESRPDVHVHRNQLHRDGSRD